MPSCTRLVFTSPPPQRVLTEKRGFDEPVHHALAGGVSGYLLGAVMTMAGARPVINLTPRPLDQLDGSVQSEDVNKGSV